MIEYVLFDLDGTLTDPKEGITKSVQYALASFGIEEENLDNLEPFIGPPLKDSFMEFYGFDDEKAELAIAKYRERFADTGIFENRVYEGIPLLIRKLKGNRKKLAVASSKPTVFVERILEHFDIRRYFDVVVGSELDGTRVEKEEVVKEALRQLYGENREEWEEKKKKTVMVGDRKFDVAGAKAQGIRSVAVAYGYGKMDELRIAKPDDTVRTVGELEALLLQDIPQKKKDDSATQIWFVLFPALVFFVVKEIGAYLGGFILSMLVNSLPASVADLLVIWDESKTKITGPTGNGAAIMAAIAFLVAGGVCIKYFAKTDIRKAKKKVIENPAVLKKPMAYACMILAVPAMGLGLNYLFSRIGLTTVSESYHQTSEMQYAAAIPMALLVYGIIGPIAEEIIFRGVIYNRMKENNKIITSVIVSSLVFAVYHLNPVQGIYAFIMGCMIAGLYEVFGHFLVPVFVHVGCNVFVYLMSVSGIGERLHTGWWVCIALLLVGAGLLTYCFLAYYQARKALGDMDTKEAEDMVWNRKG